MKFTRSHLLIIVYSLLVVLYTLYLTQLRHPWRYYLEFMLISGYCFFILQGILLRSRNWGILLLLPLAVSVIAIVAGYLLLFILRLGGGTLLDADSADMILLSGLVIGGGVYSLRWIKGGKGARKGKK
ncbi:MAG: hypothetical protein BGO55_32590 [Sphingobacteriales bacterium 50-39]|nr:hypothetical protein [Sphingobacteriales bacterium]OJW61217.1 MAG: hypothetical protein BGO55_32590 [Sphingobacteriales bacterium 50-39]